LDNTIFKAVWIHSSKYLVC